MIVWRKDVLRPGTCVALALLLAGCPLPLRDDLPDWSEGFEDGADADTDDTGVAPVPGAFAVLAPPVDDIGWEVRLHETGDYEAACAIEFESTPTAAEYQERDCTLDIRELDLYGGGLDFDFSVPDNLCEFVVWRHYMYEDWEVGIGPTTVKITLDAEGEIVAEENAFNGEPFCTYDYSTAFADGPNCCLGSYQVELWSEGGTEADEISPPVAWGGTPADCYDGAAFIDPEATFTEDGWPQGRIVFVDRDDFEKRFHWDALSGQPYVGNVALANFVDPADHGGGLPAGLRGFEAQPYYLFQCYDHAEELLAEIRLVVREWNTQAEFDKILADPPDASGDPDAVGTEPVSGHPLDDRSDWATATPGADLFLMNSD